MLALPREEFAFERRGFAAGEPAARQRLQRAVAAVLDGYQLALDRDDERNLGDALEKVELELRGFACEGAAMALTLLDATSPWRRDRWASYLRGSGAPHAYMVHVGAGLALARLRRPLVLPRARFDPLLCWLVADGYGFHEGFFRWKDRTSALPLPARIAGYARRAFDQGLGRSLWFACSADGGGIARTIDRFPHERRADLWSGVGLACTYAGGVGESAIESLRTIATSFTPELAQGAAFAAQARARAHNTAEHTDLACRILCGCSAEHAAAATVSALEGLPPDGAVPAYEVWRQRVRERLGAREAA